jgi:hypothetical protein
VTEPKIALKQLQQHVNAAWAGTAPNSTGSTNFIQSVRFLVPPTVPPSLKNFRLWSRTDWVGKFGSFDPSVLAKKITLFDLLKIFISTLFTNQTVAWNSHWKNCTEISQTAPPMILANRLQLKTICENFSAILLKKNS